MSHASGTPRPARSVAGLSIRMRLYLGFGILVLSGIGLAVFAVSQLNTIDAASERSAKLSANAQRVLEAGRMVETLRESALRNAVTWQDAPVKDFNEGAGRLLELLNAAEKAAVSPARRNAYTVITAKVNAITAAFGELARQTASAAEDRKILFKVGDDVTAAAAAMIKAAQALDDTRFSARRKPRKVPCCWSASPTGGSWRRTT